MYVCICLYKVLCNTDNASSLHPLTTEIFIDRYIYPTPLRVIVHLDCTHNFHKLSTSLLQPYKAETTILQGCNVQPRNLSKAVYLQGLIGT